MQLLNVYSNEALASVGQSKLNFNNLIFLILFIDQWIKLGPASSGMNNSHDITNYKTIND